jgi:hypothetical protein
MKSYTRMTGEQDDRSAEEEISAKGVRNELNRILSSRHFRTSKRSVEFLKYVVEQKLQGNETLIKERLIGIEVFGRKANYATGDDPVVRVQAGDVRRRLDAYHSEFADSLEIIIELPTGSYVPIFRRFISQDVGRDSTVGSTSLDDFAPALLTDSDLERTARALSVASPISVDSTNDLQHLVIRRKPRRLFLLIGLLLIFMSVGGYYWLQKTNSSNEAFTKFWGPIMDSPKPTVISLGKPFVYEPGARLFDQYIKEHPDSFASPADRHNKYLALDRNTPLLWSDMRPISNSGPAIGGVRAAMLLSAVLGHLGKLFVVRFGDDGSYLELRDSPAIIVGGLNNRWTSEIDQDLHFGIHDNNSYQYIVETGTSHIWKEESTSLGWIDYAIVTRELVGPTGQFLIKIAGMSDNGTEAASELITNNEELSKAIQTLPPHWERKNLQLLVQTDIIGGKAGPPKLIATYIW